MNVVVKPGRGRLSWGLALASSFALALGALFAPLAQAQSAEDAAKIAANLPASSQAVIPTAIAKTRSFASSPSAGWNPACATRSPSYYPVYAAN